MACKIINPVHFTQYKNKLLSTTFMLLKTDKDKQNVCLNEKTVFSSQFKIIRAHTQTHDKSQTLKKKHVEWFFGTNIQICLWCAPSSGRPLSVLVSSPSSLLYWLSAAFSLVEWKHKSLILQVSHLQQSLLSSCDALKSVLVFFLCFSQSLKSRWDWLESAQLQSWLRLRSEADREDSEDRQKIVSQILW